MRMGDLSGNIVIKEEILNDDNAIFSFDVSEKVKFPPQFKPTKMKLKCPKCPLLFSSEDSLNAHKTKHVCQFCDFEIRHISETNEHFLNTHVDYDADKFTCLICSEVFESRPRLLHHVRDIHTRVLQHQCSFCDKSFRDSRSLKNHERFHTGDKPFACDICDKRFVDKRTLVKHEQSHDGKRYECSVCKKTFKQEAKMKAHMKMHDTNSPYKCDVCNKVLSCSYSLTLHKKIHTSFQCDICDEKFERRTAWQYHMLAHKGISSYDCSICNKSFPARCELNKHMLCHNTERPFECAICKKSFTTKKILAFHLRVHTESPTHQCPDCDKSFYTRFDLKAHSIVHTKTSDFQCNVCHKYFGSKTRLAIHAHIHDAVKPYKCEICKRTFAQSGTLKEHMVSHSTGNTVRCKLCGLTFKHRRSERKHMKKKHPEVDMNLVRPEKIETSDQDSIRDILAAFPSISQSDKGPSNAATDTSDTVEIKGIALSPRGKDKRDVKRKMLFDEVPSPSMQQQSETPLSPNKKRKRTPNKHSFPISKSVKKKDKIKHVSSVSKTINESITDQSQSPTSLPNPTEAERKRSSVSTIVQTKKFKRSPKKIPKASKTQTNMKRTTTKKSSRSLKNSPTKSPKSSAKKCTQTKDKCDLKCDFCGASQFEDMASYENHLRTHDGSSRYKCPVCDKAFRYQASLEKHLKVHSNVIESESNIVSVPKVDHTCGFCDAVFSSADDLKSHLPIHTEAILRESAELSQQSNRDRNMFDVFTQIKQEQDIDIVGHICSGDTSSHQEESGIHDHENEMFSSSIVVETKPLSNDTGVCVHKQSLQSVSQNPNRDIVSSQLNDERGETNNSQQSANQPDTTISDHSAPHTGPPGEIPIDIAHLKQEPPDTDIVSSSSQDDRLTPVISETVSLADSQLTDISINNQFSDSGGQVALDAVIKEEPLDPVDPSDIIGVVAPADSTVENEGHSSGKAGNKGSNKKSKGTTKDATVKQGKTKTPVKRKAMTVSPSHKCETCREVFPSPAKLKKHLNSHTSPKNNKMKINIKFTSPKKSRSKSASSPPVGEQQSAMPDTKDNADQNNQTESSPKKTFPCEVCSKLFASKGGLGRHRQVHKSVIIPENNKPPSNMPKTPENRPKENSIEPVENSIKPAQNSLELVEKAIEPVGESIEPVENSIEPMENFIQPVEKFIEPVKNAIGLPENSIEPFENSNNLATLKSSIDFNVVHSFNCIICGDRFESEQSLTQHAKTHVRKTMMNRVVVLSEEPGETE